MKKSKPLSRSDARLNSRPPFERMMRIHQGITTGQFPNATTLGAELEVATKTIHRDIEFMRERLELPIRYDELAHGYHYTQEVSSFPTLHITEGELVALLIAEKALHQYRGTNFEQPLISAFKKMEAALPDTISFNFSDWDESISFRTSAEPLLNLESLDQLAKATARRQQLQITYRKPGRPQPETRVIDPYHLANINGEWFLFAHDHLRQELRTFVPARIKTSQPTGKTFARPPKFSVEKILRDSFGVHSGAGEHQVVLRFDAHAADYIREKRWHPSQQLKELKKGGVELRLKLSSLGEVERWILGWGGRVVVHQPKALAQSVRAAARQILKNGS